MIQCDLALAWVWYNRCHGVQVRCVKCSDVIGVSPLLQKLNVFNWLLYITVYCEMWLASDLQCLHFRNKQTVPTIYSFIWNNLLSSIKFNECLHQIKILPTLYHLHDKSCMVFTINQLIILLKECLYVMSDWLCLLISLFVIGIFILNYFPVSTNIHV